MTKNMHKSWTDLGFLSLFRSPFLLPSLALHLIALLYVALAVRESPANEIIVPPIPLKILEIAEGEGSSPDKSIGPGEGPGGPRTRPKYGNVARPRQRTGKLNVGSLETLAPSEEPNSAPQPPALPGPRVLAPATRLEPLSSKEFFSDSLVQLPIKESPNSPSLAANLEADQKNLASLKSSGDAAGIKALKEGPQLPGDLKGTGTAPGLYGVPGGSRTGTGLAGGGTGSGTGGGSKTGLRGTSTPITDYNQYLNMLKKRVTSVWRYPEGVSGLQNVTIRFSLDRAGKLAEAEVLESTDPRINPSALEAMKRASPFPPIPANLKDLAGEPLIIQFAISIRRG
jgi:TonB family protein